MNIYELCPTPGIFGSREANSSPPEGQEQRAPEPDADVCSLVGLGDSPLVTGLSSLLSHRTAPSAPPQGDVSDA